MGNAERHDPTYYNSSFGRWVVCSCGWRWGYTGTQTAAQIAHGEHLLETTEETR